MLANIARVPHAFGRLPNATGSPQRIRPLADWQPVLPRSSTPSLGLSPALSCPGRFLCRARAVGCAATLGGAPGLTRQSLSRSRAAAFTFQRAAYRARACRRRLAPTFSALGQVPLGLTFRPFLASFRRRQLHTRATRFRQTNRDSLLWRSRAVFSLTDVLHFFPNEFTGPRRWRKPFAFVLAGPVQLHRLRHNKRVSPQRADLDAS